MSRWQRFVAAVGGDRIVVAFGGLYVALAVAKVFSIATSDGTLVSAAADFVLVGGPGLVLLVGGYWLRRSDLPADVYPRIVAWCLAGFVAMLVVIELVNHEPGVIISQPFWTALLATALGTTAGFAVGVSAAQAAAHATEVERVNRKLADANRELEHQNDRLESFASMLAHELRNPLHVAELYLGQAIEGDREAAEHVEAAHGRIEEMVEVLLVTARKADANPDTEPVALAAVAGEAWDDVRVQGAELVVETDRTVRANSVHLRHLFENLFKNSVEHGDEGVTIRVGDLETGFYVEDDGPGIPEDRRERVFDAGYTTGGIGFGLAFVSRIVETYDWDCTVTEADGGGARFEFTNVETVSAVDRQRH